MCILLIETGDCSDYDLPLALWGQLWARGNRMTSQARWPVYRYVGREICRQDVQGGDWTSLSKEEANHLLRAFDGVDIREDISARDALAEVISKSKSR